MTSANNESMKRDLRKPVRFLLKYERAQLMKYYRLSSLMPSWLSSILPRRRSMDFWRSTRTSYVSIVAWRTFRSIRLCPGRARDESCHRSFRLWRWRSRMTKGTEWIAWRWGRRNCRRVIISLVVSFEACIIMNEILVFTFWRVLDPIGAFFESIARKLIQVEERNEISMYSMECVRPAHELNITKFLVTHALVQR